MKADLILLHGALGSKYQLETLRAELEDKFKVHSINFEGHGDRVTSEDFSIDRFADNLVNYISENDLSQPNIFGYSMGGYVALYAEAMAPGLIGKIMTLGTKFNWTPESASKEVRMLNPAVIEEKIPHFAKHLGRIHAPNDWKENMKKTAKMMKDMGENPPLNQRLISKINTDVLLTIGGEDQMVSRQETEFILNQLSNAELFIFDGFEHPIEKINLSELSREITSYFG